MTYLQKCLECREPSSDLSLVENIHTHIGQWRIYDTVSHSSCRSNFGPTIMLELKHIFTKKLFSMNWWVSYDYDFHWYLPLSSCHGFYLFLKKNQKNHLQANWRFLYRYFWKQCIRKCGHIPWIALLIFSFL